MTAADGPDRFPLLPRFAEAILDSNKTIELRRTCVAAPPGTTYASRPAPRIMAVVRMAVLATGTPPDQARSGDATALTFAVTRRV